LQIKKKKFFFVLNLDSIQHNTYKQYRVLNS